jgi:hypothetical protein
VTSFLADCPQQFSEKTMDLPLHLDQSLGFSPTMPPQGLGYQREPDPTICLTARHRALRQKDEVRPGLTWVIEQFHELHSS